MKRPLTCYQADAEWAIFIAALYVSVPMLGVALLTPIFVSIFNFIAQKTKSCPIWVTEASIATDQAIAIPVTNRSAFTGFITGMFTTVNGVLGTAATVAVSVDWLFSYYGNAKGKQAICNHDEERDAEL